jgi:hypothetical protein
MALFHQIAVPAQDGIRADEKPQPAKPCGAAMSAVRRERLNSLE